MRPPFPGMDPWLEHPVLWPDVHNRLIAAIADDLTDRLPGRYYIALEARTAISATLGVDRELTARPDRALITTYPIDPARRAAPAASGAEAVGVLEVDVPQVEEIQETYLEVREAGRGRLITLIEVLSPTNKQQEPGRKKYLRKRQRVLRSRTSLVEIDLLRAGAPMPLSQAPEAAGAAYRVLVSRGWSRPRSQLYYFGVRTPIPAFPVPLLPEDRALEVDLNPLLHRLYERARYHMRTDYTRPPVPPLSPADDAWARGLLSSVTEARVPHPPEPAPRP